jgi:hypothetical protein
MKLDRRRFLGSSVGVAPVIVLKNTGYWTLEENTRETTDALTKFL